MASSYAISGGDGRVNLGEVQGTYIATQISSDVALDADITVKLQQSTDGINYIDLASTSTTMVAGVGSVLLESYDFTLTNVYLYITVGSATLGTLDIFTSVKKKVNSGDVDATITGEITVEGNAALLANQEILIRNTRALEEIKELLKINNTHLSLITGSDIN